MRARVVLATILLLAVLAALLAAATCGGERSALPVPDSDADDAAPAGMQLDERDGTWGVSGPSRRPGSAATASVPRRPSPGRAAAPAPPEPAVVEERRFHEPVAQWEEEKRIELG